MIFCTSSGTFGTSVCIAVPFFPDQLNGLSEKVYSKKFPQDECVDVLQHEGVSSSLVISLRIEIGACELNIDFT